MIETYTQDLRLYACHGVALLRLPPQGCLGKKAGTIGGQCRANGSRIRPSTPKAEVGLREHSGSSSQFSFVERVSAAVRSTTALRRQDWEQSRSVAPWQFAGSYSMLAGPCRILLLGACWTLARIWSLRGKPLTFSISHCASYSNMIWAGAMFPCSLRAPQGSIALGGDRSNSFLY